jgi:hypothetical protein
MQMTGSNGIFSVPSEHLPGLVALVVLMPALWLGLSGLRALARRGSQPVDRLLVRYDGLPFTAKTVLFGSLVGAVVHAAIVPTHWGDERVTAILFIVDVVGFALSFWWAFTSRLHWRTVSVLLLGGTAATYALYIVLGWETMDLVGLLTTTVELAAALVVLSPMVSPRGSARREYWLALSAIPVALVTLLGTGEIASATSATAVSTSSSTPKASSSMANMPSMHAKKTHPTTASPLSLATTSAAGPIAWPDNMAAMAPGMKMATPDCNAQPTAAEQRAAVSLVDTTVAAATPYKSLAAAKAAGYVPVTQSGKRIVHYINPSIYRQGHLLDPKSIPVLVYANTAHGAVLLAAMYLMPRSSGEKTPPQPGGCLTQWHIHTDLCFSSDRVVGNDADAPCTAGSTNAVTQPMMHVWMTPVTGGPLAPEPSARSEVLGAMQVPAMNPVNGTA